MKLQDHHIQMWDQQGLGGLPVVKVNLLVGLAQQELPLSQQDYSSQSHTPELPPTYGKESY